MTLTLPPDVTLVSAQPDVSEADGGTLTWVGLPNPAGLVKVRVQVPESLVGATLTASLSVTDATGAVATGTTATTVR